MSRFLRPRNIFIAGGIGAAVFLFPRTSAQANPIGNVFDTTANKNIGDRWSAGGGSNTHTAGVATPRGKADQTISPQEHATGASTPTFKNMNADQKKGEPGVVGKAFHQAHLGTDKGK